MSWADEEAKTADFGDERLNKRMAVVLSDLGEKPNQSVSQACNGDWAKVTAVYRFFDNDKIYYEDILSSHHDATLERIRQEEEVLFVQDTATLVRTVNKGPKGLGAIKLIEKDEIMLRPTIALTPDRVCPGVVQADVQGGQEKSHALNEGINRLRKKKAHIGQTVIKPLAQYKGRRRRLGLPVFRMRRAIFMNYTLKAGNMRAPSVRTGLCAPRRIAVWILTINLRIKSGAA